MSDEAMSKRDFFISYTGSDRAWAEWVGWQLEDAGYTVILQAWDFRPGENFVQQMLRALDRAERTIALPSADYLESFYATAELTAALTQDRLREASLLLLRIEPVTLPRLLRPWIYIDLVGLDEHAARRRLLEGVQRGRRKPMTQPPFPREDEREPPRFPEQSPTISNLPERNSNFVGRAELLELLRRSFTQSTTTVIGETATGEEKPVAGPSSLALVGLGGVGKSALALEHAHRRAGDYQIRWWVPAEEPLAIPASLAGLARELGISERSEKELVSAVLKKLAARERWLLVFDNADKPEDLRSYRPSGGGHVLITSRNPGWGKLTTPIKVGVLPHEEAITFLLRRTRDPDEKAAGDLAAQLDELPLALEQAAAYMEETGLKLVQYLELYRDHRDELLGKGDRVAHGATVDATFRLASERVAEASPEAAQLLGLCAFLAREPIPLDLLMADPRAVPTPLRGVARDEVVRNETVGALYRYSLVERDQTGISLHTLVQAVIRNGLKPHERRRWAGRAVWLVAAHFPDRSDDLFTWRKSQLLLPHALAAARWSVQLGVEDETAAALLNRVALYLWARADLYQARELLESTQAIIEARLGPRHIQAATNLSTLGKVLREFGDLDGARNAHMRALAIRRCQPERNPESIAWSLGNLGKVLRQQGHLARARRFHQRALTILEAARGPNDPDVAWSLGNLGRTLLDLGDLAEALRVHERALAIRESVLPPNHPDVAWSLRNLAATLQALGKPHVAHERYSQALAIFEDRFGPDHPEVVTTRGNLQAMSDELGELRDPSDAGFVSLFDDLDQWKMAGPGRFVPLGDGVMETEGGMGLWWYTGRSFRDFVLEVEWMATSNDDNSGVFIRFPDPGDDPWTAVRSGYEVQIDDRPTSEWKTGAIYGFSRPSASASKPVGEWNTYRIQAVEQRYLVILNGVKVNNFVGNRRSEGYVGLQNHGKRNDREDSRVRFRNLRVKELPPT